MTRLVEKTKHNKKPLDFLKLPFHNRVEGGDIAHSEAHFLVASL